MIVHGISVCDAQLGAALDRMKAGAFTLGDLVDCLVSAGVPLKSHVGFLARDVAGRAADRLIQRERKAGRIVLDGRQWAMIHN